MLEELISAGLGADKLEELLPMIKKLIKPMNNKFKRYLEEGNIILIKTVKGSPYVFVIGNKQVQIHLEAEPKHIISTEEFVEKIVAGEFKFD